MSIGVSQDGRYHRTNSGYRVSGGPGCALLPQLNKAGSHLHVSSRQRTCSLKAEWLWSATAAAFRRIDADLSPNTA